MIIITTDSTSDLTKKQLEEKKIPVIPLIVTLGEKDYFDNGVDVNEEKIFDFVRETKVLPKTAARSSEDFKVFFNQFVKRGDIVIHIGLGSELSSTFQNAVVAAEEIGAEKVFVIDSKSLSSGTGLLVLEAIRLRDEKKDAKSIVKEIQRLAEKCQTSFIVDKLDYLYKGGRCSKFSFSIGSLLKIRPRLQLIDGKIVNTGKDMGTLKSVLKKYVDYELEKYSNYRKNICFVTHTVMDQGVVDEIIDYVKSKGIFDEVVESTAGSVITSHCGPGTLGILYLCDQEKR